MIITHLLSYIMGIKHESTQNEKEIELTYEAAAQSYKNTLPNDTSKFDYYGNPRTKTDTTKQVLPQNSRTESHLPGTKKNSDISQTRKRN